MEADSGSDQLTACCSVSRVSNILVFYICTTIARHWSSLFQQSSFTSQMRRRPYSDRNTCPRQHDQAPIPLMPIREIPISPPNQDRDSGVETSPLEPRLPSLNPLHLALQVLQIAEFIFPIMPHIRIRIRILYKNPRTRLSETSSGYLPRRSASYPTSPASPPPHPSDHVS